MSHLLRIGAVEYLNTAPLVCGLPEYAPNAILEFDLPSRLADRLSAGELDVALAPSVEIARHPEWTVLSTACIGCRGAVLSVKLYFRREPQRVTTLALDEGSRTSAVLAQILLAEQFGVRPRLTPLPIGCDGDDCDADAVLVIGDRAIRGTLTGACETWDLGEKWLDSTGLPFVFAAWAARPGVDVWSLEAALDAARDQGCRQLEAIAAERSAGMNLPQGMVLAYLRDHLHFYLGASERQGLTTFCRKAASLGLLPSHTSFNYHDSTTRSGTRV